MTTNLARLDLSTSEASGPMATTPPPDQELFAQVLHPLAYERFGSVAKFGTRFVHYTDANAAMNILQSKEIWMRKSSCMEDYLEIQYGLDRLYRAYRNPKIGDHFKSVLNSLFDGITIDIEKHFDGWTPHFLADTYFTCVSEHSDEEDTFGRLSMWRAYGDTTGVAFVVNNPLFLNPAEGLKATVNPVSYLNDDEFENEFTRIANISKEAEFFKAHGRDEVTARIFHMLRFAVLCTKHPGFPRGARMACGVLSFLGGITLLDERYSSDKKCSTADI